MACVLRGALESLEVFQKAKQLADKRLREYQWALLPRYLRDGGNMWSEELQSRLYLILCHGEMEAMYALGRIADAHAAAKQILFLNKKDEQEVKVSSFQISSVDIRNVGAAQDNSFSPFHNKMNNFCPLLPSGVFSCLPWSLGNIMNALR